MFELIAAVLIVSSEKDLRQAIADANARAGADTIKFEGVRKITLASALPVVTDELVIDGGERVELDGGKREFPGLSFSGVKCDVLGLTLTGFSAAVRLDGTHDCIVGAGNVIVGNGTGVVITGAARDNQVFGNLIGVGADRKTPSPNDRGVEVLGAAVNTEITNNRILHNREEGVVVRGESVTGTSLDANDLAGNGTMFDLQDGANHEQRAPILTSAVTEGSSIHVRGTLESTPNTRYRVQFFAGGWYLSFRNVTTDAHGLASFDVTLSTQATAGSITATATNETTNDTSEHSFWRTLRR